MGLENVCASTSGPFKTADLHDQPTKVWPINQPYMGLKNGLTIHSIYGPSNGTPARYCLSKWTGQKNK